MLTDRTIKGLKATGKRYKRHDAGGLFICVTEKGTKSWRYRYNLFGKEQWVTIGRYPKVTLIEARRKADNFRDGIEADGIIISDHNPTFAQVAIEWLDSMKPKWGEGNYLRAKRFLLDDIGSQLPMPISEVKPAHILEALKKMDARGLGSSVNRARAMTSRVFRYAVARTYTQTDPAQMLLGAFIEPPKRNRAALSDPKQIGKLMRKIRVYNSRTAVRHGLLISAYTFMRPGEVRHLEWTEINFEKKQILIKGDKMKKGKDLIVPMSRQVEQVLSELYLIKQKNRYVFKGRKNRKNDEEQPMSENTILKAIRLMGYGPTEMTAHGFRSIASTTLYESNLWRGDAIERQLAHVEANQVKAAYNRAKYIDERTKMMQWYADYLDGLAAS